MAQTRESLEVILKDIIGSSVQECHALYEAVVSTAHLEGEVVEIGVFIRKNIFIYLLWSKRN